MKIFIITLLTIILTLTSSFSQVATSDLANLTNDLNHLLGKRYYILKNNKSENELTVIIYKRYDVTRDGKISYYEYPENIIDFLSKNVNRSYKFKINFEISPYIPSSWIDESIKKENIKLILIISLIGVISIYVGFILYRIFTRKSKNQTHDNGKIINQNNRKNNF